MSFDEVNIPIQVLDFCAIYISMTKNPLSITYIVYQAGQGIFTFSLGTLEYTPTCQNYGIKYYPVPGYPSFVSFNESTLTFTIDTNDSASIGTYNLSLILNMTLTYKPFIKDLNWTLNVVATPPYYYITNTAPYFVPAPQKIEIQAGVQSIL